MWPSVACLVGTVLTLIYIPLFAYTVDGGLADADRERLAASISE
jgi:hypothetical protein